MTASPYSLLMLAGIAVSLVFWSRLAKRDERLLVIYIAALVSAFLGAKVVYLAAEGWLFWDAPDRWMIWATGKTILGALLGGYAGVEVAKRVTGYAQATGDWFAVIAPVGIVLGRVGCLLHGCCLGRACAPAWWTVADAHGVARWPAVPVEIGFNLLVLAFFLTLNGVKASTKNTKGYEKQSSPFRAISWTQVAARLRGQHFHVYLMAYGAFRFAHEFLRATPRVTGAFFRLPNRRTGLRGAGRVAFRGANPSRRFAAGQCATVTGVPSCTFWKNVAAINPGMRMQPCEAA